MPLATSVTGWEFPASWTDVIRYGSSCRTSALTSGSSIPVVEVAIGGTTGTDPLGTVCTRGREVGGATAQSKGVTRWDVTGVTT